MDDRQHTKLVIPRRGSGRHGGLMVIMAVSLLFLSAGGCAAADVVACDALLLLSFLNAL